MKLSNRVMRPANNSLLARRDICMFCSARLLRNTASQSSLLRKDCVRPSSHQTSLLFQPSQTRLASFKATPTSFQSNATEKEKPIRKLPDWKTSPDRNPRGKSGDFNSGRRTPRPSDSNRPNFSPRTRDANSQKKPDWSDPPPERRSFQDRRPEQGRNAPFRDRRNDDGRRFQGPSRNQDGSNLRPNDRRGQRGRPNNVEQKEEKKDERIAPNQELDMSDDMREADMILNEDDGLGRRGVSRKKVGRFESTSANKKGRRAEKYALNDEDVQEEIEDLEEKSRKQRKEERRREREEQREAARQKRLRPIEIPPFINVANLATALHVRAEDFLVKLEELGFEDVTMSHVMAAEDAGLVASEYGFEPFIDRSDTEDLKARPVPEDRSMLPARPPIVTIMGHVDHGKTTILDYIRKTSVAASEHGGITQHIGAFSVPLASSNRNITFLDTPGHAAFLTMRQRGANVTDIVVLVVAADDSVKPQTIEAIKHAKAANVSIIVAINKVDKDEADVHQVKQDLFANGIEVEDFDGDIQAIPVSGKSGEGMDALEEAIVTQAEVLDLRAESSGAAEGWVLEATTKLAGRVATVLVRRGTLRLGDVIVAGNTWARVRTLYDAAGQELDEAGPGTPVEVTGWRVEPAAGDEVLQVPGNSEQRATSVVAYRQDRTERLQTAVDMEAVNFSRKVEAERQEREKQVATEARDQARAGSKTKAQTRQAVRVAKEQMADQEAAGVKKATDLYLVIKADVGGSAEAVATMIEGLPIQDYDLNIKILSKGFGQLSESDVARAASVPDKRGILINFNQRVPPEIYQLASTVDVRVVDSNIIYNAIGAVRSIIEEYLPPIITTSVTGEAEIAQPFDIKEGKKVIKVAGCRVRNGVVGRNSKVRVYRGDVGDKESVVFTGTLSSLRSHKKAVTEMRKGSECGLSFQDWEGFRAGDVIQCFQEHSETRRLPEH